MSKKTLNELTLKDNFYLSGKTGQRNGGTLYAFWNCLSQDERAEGVLEGKREDILELLSDLDRVPERPGKRSGKSGRS